jgi:UDPglucose 6-dehydrogenase
MNIAIVGTGYVGLVTGTCFAETGNQVVCIDIDEKKVNQMRNGVVPIYEPGLENIFLKNTKSRNLTFTTSLKEGVKDAEIVFLALPTPPGDDGSADLSYVVGVATDLSTIITDYKVIINKSTVPVGTAERVTEILSKNLNRNLFDVVSNPEFLREGHAVKDFLHPDRVVIGTSSEKARVILEKLYKPFINETSPLLIMDERSSEMTKYAANSYLATRISFMNEIANLCEKVGANVDNVRLGIGSDDRIGSRFLFPGIGFGGSCFPKDILALVKTANDHGYSFETLKTIININEIQKSKLVEKIKNYFGADLTGKTIALWGLAFKPGTDDIREASSIVSINGLLAAGASIRVYDPAAIGNIKSVFGDQLFYASDEYNVLEGADALGIVTEWEVFKNADLGIVKDLLKEPIIFDGRNLFSLEVMTQNGFQYNSIGREKIGKNKI